MNTNSIINKTFLTKTEFRHLKTIGWEVISSNHSDIDASYIVHKMKFRNKIRHFWVNQFE